jgi:transposase
MRGYETGQQEMFFQGSLESLIPENHPLRDIKRMVESLLEQMSFAFDQMYSTVGRPSIPPEQLLRGELLRILYSIRSETQLMEQLHFNFLYRWFVGIGMNERVWDVSTYSKNRERLLSGDIARLFFEKVKQLADEHSLLSNEHFTLDGTLLEAAAGIKSFRPKGEDQDPPEGGENFRQEKLSNRSHQSKTDPQSRLFKKGKGKEAKLSFMGHVITENRNGLVVNVRLGQANGTAERDAGVEMMLELNPTAKRMTLAGDKNFDTQEFVRDMRALHVTPHVAQNNTNRNSAIDGRTTRHAGYAVSQRKRKRVEQVFGWGKVIGGLHKLRHVGQALNQWLFTLTTAAYNLVRMRRLIPV